MSLRVLRGWFTSAPLAPIFLAGIALFAQDEADDHWPRVGRQWPSGCRTNIDISALHATSRAGFVMANLASDARGSELEVRRKMIETGTVDVMI